MKMKPHKLIRKQLTKSYQKDLDRLSDILIKMSKFVERRQIIDNDIITHHDIKHLNKVLKIELDYKKVLSKQFVIEDKKIAVKTGQALKILASLIDNKGVASFEDSLILRALDNVDINLFSISLSETNFDKQHDYVLYENLTRMHVMSTHTTAERRCYFLSYQYDLMSDSDKRRYENEVSSVRKIAALKAAETRKKNKSLMS